MRKWFKEYGIVCGIVLFISSLMIFGILNALAQFIALCKYVFAGFNVLRNG
jgi:hypothetical protein